jgi:2-polyprenyl-3-methyl-5-hydroxy-6-metoxy-1,4-benzoquinol methylase
MDQVTVNYYSQNAQQVADRYEAVVSSLSEHFLEAFKPNSKLLDIGCGSGRDLAVLHKLGHECYGVDPTKEFVDIAQRVHPELSGRIALDSLPAMAPPFGGKFDGVLCSAVLMHIEIDQLLSAALSIKNCLKLGGRLLYSVPSKRLDVVSEDRDGNGRLFVPDQSGRLQSIFESLGFKCHSKWGNADSMGRDAVEWESLLMELTVA